MDLRKRKKAGLPGTLVYTGKPRDTPVHVNLIEYDAKKLMRKDIRVEDCSNKTSARRVQWINVTGINDVTAVAKLGKIFDLHPLLLEDVVHPEQRPKLEDFDNCLFLVLRVLTYERNHLSSEQISLVIGKNFLISFQETPGDAFDTIRERLTKDGTRIRKAGADYLGYALLDAIVDSYFSILERIGEHVEAINNQLLQEPKTLQLKMIHDLKRQAIMLRKSTWPLREAVRSLERVESGLIRKNTLIYLRDVYDHTVQVIDNIESLRDTMSSLLDLYLSSVSNRMNEVMKVLTIIATIFIPLTFIAGVYGMNFRRMPELYWTYGYGFALLIMALVAVVMLLYFRKKKWL